MEVIQKAESRIAPVAPVAMVLNFRKRSSRIGHNMSQLIGLNAWTVCKIIQYVNICSCTVCRREFQLWLLFPNPTKLYSSQSFTPTNRWHSQLLCQCLLEIRSSINSLRGCGAVLDSPVGACIAICNAVRYNISVGEKWNANCSETVVAIDERLGKVRLLDLWRKNWRCHFEVTLRNNLI